MDWPTIPVSVGQLVLTGYSLNAGNQDGLLVCETEAVLDKRRVYLRSSVQLVNNLDFEMRVSFPLWREAGARDYSANASHWVDSIVKPGKKWNLPLDSICHSSCTFFKVSPLIRFFL